MFLNSSRYFKQKTRESVTRDGRRVTALSLRRLPIVKGNAVVIKGNDRLDIMSHRNYNNSTMFWHIADANTELQANDLVEQPGRTIVVPED